MIDFTSKPKYRFNDLVALVRCLRAPDGCPWDRVQTHESIRRNFLEETYEACEAIDAGDPVSLQEELGDVLLHVVFHAGIEADAGRFTIDDVCDTVCKKMISRHPTLFGTGPACSWDELKRQEKGQTTCTEAMDSVARSLPALWRAEKLQGKAGPPPDAADAAHLLEQAASTFGRTVAAGQTDAADIALGDALFAAVNASRAISTDPEEALHGACERFIRQFSHLEQAAVAAGESLDQLPASALEALWNPPKSNQEK